MSDLQQANERNFARWHLVALPFRTHRWTIVFAGTLPSKQAGRGEVREV
jgi:hypothetical protein